jgi:hypothetical protein
LRHFNTIVQCVVLTFVLVASAVSIAALTPAPKTATESLAIKEAPAAVEEKTFTTSQQEGAQTKLGGTG